MQLKSLSLLLSAMFLSSFQSSNSDYYVFQYPNQSETRLRLNLTGFENFSQEYRGNDYQVKATSADQINMSIIYYKLTKEEELNSNIFFEDAREQEFQYIDKTVTTKAGVRMHEFEHYAISKVNASMYVIVRFSKNNYSRNDSLLIQKMIHSVRYDVKP